jgi:DNA ligase-1
LNAHNDSTDATEFSNQGLYNPCKQNYHPIQDATWKKGENIPYLALAKTLELVDTFKPLHQTSLNESIC